MTICIASDGFSPQVGGIATFNRHLVSLLTNTAHKVIVLSIEYNSEEDDLVKTEGLFTNIVLRKTYQQYYKKWQKYFRRGGYDAPNWMAIGMATRQWLLTNHKQFDIDVIEVSDYGGSAVFLCDNSLPPVVVTGHGSLLQLSRYNYSNRDDSYKVICKLEELSFHFADAIIAHSQVNKLDLEGIFKRRIESAAIPWVNDGKTDNGTATKNELLVIGGLQPAKGVYIMAETMQLLLLKEPGIKLNWIGGDTWLAPGQQKVSSYLKKKYPSAWGNNFIWKREHSYIDTQQELLSSSLVIIPSLFETFSYVALEAASAGKAIIITDKTGASYLFTHGHDAWIVPANDPEKLAEAIQHLYNDPELCKKLGDNAKRMVERTFNEKEIVEERIRLFQSIIQNRKPHTDTFEERLSFLKKYTAPSRKLYYFLRAFAKKLIGRGKNE